MYWLFYKIILFAAAVFYLPRYYFGGKFSRGVYTEALGKYESGKPADTKQSIWIHCSSVGEVRIASALLDELNEQNRNCRYVLTVRTETGRAEAERLCADKAEIYYAPLDLKRYVKRALKKFRPRKLVLIETELWPHMIRQALKSGVDLYLVNGRISDRTFGQYRAFKPLFGPLLRLFEAILMQSERDRQRILEIGATNENCHVLHNIKYDLMRKNVGRIDPDQVRKMLRIGPDDRFIIAGSTRGGEEKTVIREYSRLKEKHSDLKLIIAPRHLERNAEVEAYLKDAHLSYVFRSSLDDATEASNYDVILADKMGQLMQLYSISRTAFVGGSLVDKGGQNPLEPVALGVPTCFGPNMQNFEEIADTLIHMRMAFKINDSSGMYDFFDQALQGKIATPDPRELFQKYGRSAEKSAEIILRA